MTSFGPTTPWVPRWSCDVSTVSPLLTGYAVGFATEIVSGLTGRQFGTSLVTVRPCKRDCADDAWTANEWIGGTYPSPALINGQWFNLTCGTCWGTCSCSSVSEVRLPGPVVSISEVRINGVVLTGSAYRVDNSRLLVRQDGGSWPLCNDLSRPPGSSGTWTITASVGRVVPEGGAWAVGEMACELLKAMRGEDCRLPRNLTSLARQGVTISVPDVSEMFKNGLTGLFLTDLFITSVNPKRLVQSAQVYRVDTPTARRV